MEEINTDTQLSTVIDESGSSKAVGSSDVKIPVEGQKAEEPKSLRDTLKAELENIKKADAEKDEDVTEKENKPAKVEKPVKVEKSEQPESDVDEQEEKPAKGEKSLKPEKAEREASEQEDRRRSEVRRPEAPTRFLPQAKEKWFNTPREVQAEVDRIVREYETERQQYEEDRQFRESLRDFDELARSSGTNLRTALENYVNMEQTFHTDAPRAFKALLSGLRMQPHQAIASILQAYGGTPQQLSQHMAANPQAYTYQVHQPVQQVQPQQQQVRSDPRVDYLQQELEVLRLERVNEKIIAPFIESHPRYYELENDIAFFLNSGKIPASYSPQERLEIAYDMAERLNPSSMSRSYEEPVAKQNTSRVDNTIDFNGVKSVRSSPGAVTAKADDSEGLSIRETLERELRKVKR